jgi:hypothetical protein
MSYGATSPPEFAVAVATSVAAGLAAGLTWYAFARARGLGRGMCFLTSVVPATVARAALPSEDVLPFVDVFTKVDLRTSYALVEAWSAYGLAGPVAGALLGCLLGWLFERMRRPRVEVHGAVDSRRVGGW